VGVCLLSESVEWGLALLFVPQFTQPNLGSVEVTLQTKLRGGGFGTLLSLL